MIIDCDRCDVRGTACADCVIGVLVDIHEDDRPVPYLPVDVPGPAASREPGRAGPLELAEPERRALEVLADQGLIPRLRLVPRPEGGVLPGLGAGAGHDDLEFGDLDDVELDDVDVDLDEDEAPGGRPRRAG